jgi:hypothetical protein
MQNGLVSTFRVHHLLRNPAEELNVSLSVRPFAVSNSIMFDTNCPNSVILRMNSGLFWRRYLVLPNCTINNTNMADMRSSVVKATLAPVLGLQKLVIVFRN